MLIAQFFQLLAMLFNLLFTVLHFALIARIIISWVDANPYNEIVQIVFRITEPMLAPLRRLTFLRIGRIDFSPIAAFFIIGYLRLFVVGALEQLASKFVS